MGCNHGKQYAEKENNKRRSSIKKVLRFSSRRSSNPLRPVSYAGINNQHSGEHDISTRPLSMFDAGSYHDLQISKINLSSQKKKVPFFFLFIKETSTNDVDNENRSTSRRSSITAGNQ